MKNKTTEIAEETHKLMRIGYTMAMRNAGANILFIRANCRKDELNNFLSIFYINNVLGTNAKHRISRYRNSITLENNSTVLFRSYNERNLLDIRCGEYDAAFICEGSHFVIPECTGRLRGRVLKLNPLFIEGNPENYYNRYP